MDENFWTDEKVQLLKRCIDEKMSSGATATLLGCSRNTVMGKAMRLKMKFKSQAWTRSTLLPPKPEPAAAPKPEPIPTPFDGLPDVSTYWESGVTVANLEPRHCHAIVSGEPTQYCGEPIERKITRGKVSPFSYCAAHRKQYLTTPGQWRAEREA